MTVIEEMRKLLSELPNMYCGGKAYFQWYRQNVETIQKLREVSEEEWDRMAEILR